MVNILKHGIKVSLKKQITQLKKISIANKGKVAWNKGLPGVNKGIPRTEETKRKISESHQKLECIEKRYKTLKKNGRLKPINSQAELKIYNKLLSKFPTSDIYAQYFDMRYPFNCDYYIKSIDTFIEVHSNWTHNTHPFNTENPEDIQKLLKMEEKAKTSKYYKNAIYTWTDLDVRKLNIAKENHLNYIIIYNNLIIQLKGGTLVY